MVLSVSSRGSIENGFDAAQVTGNIDARVILCDQDVTFLKRAPNN